MSRPDIVLLVIAGVVSVVWYAIAQEWPAGVRLRRSWLKVKPYAAAYVKSSPATFVYAAVIMLTTWIVAGSNQRLASAVLRDQSTNLSNLRHHAIDVLLRSAFWSGSSYALPTIALLAFVLAPAEFWLGTRRATFVFAIGHVGATLLTAVGIQLALHFGRAPQDIERTIDVGASYGAVCLVGVLVYRLSPPWRYAAAAGLLAAFGLKAGLSDSFSDYGHVAALLLGYACYPFTRAAEVRERASVPIYRPWLRAPEGERQRS
jgi:hypothetical protein